jgi:hypothetical protein
MTLTTKQTEMLFQAAELHLEWYKIYYPDPPKFEVLLELNHTKLSYLIEDDTTEDDITKALNNFINQYQTMIDDYSGRANYNTGCE